MILRQNYFAIPAVDSDFLPREVDPIYTAKSNIGRVAPQRFNEILGLSWPRKDTSTRQLTLALFRKSRLNYSM
jgi:hypothetical protein